MGTPVLFVSFVPQARHPALFYYVPETADFKLSEAYVRKNRIKL
jgi:hypothetical protein